MQNENELIKMLREKMGDKTEVLANSLGKASMKTDSALLLNEVKQILEVDRDTGISAITGLDMGERIGLLYHFRVNRHLVTLITDVSKEIPKIRSITDLVPGANFHEREVSDLFGVTFEGHPSPGRLVLPETWPLELFPLRKDAKIDILSEGNKK